MKSLSSNELVELWEEGVGKSALERAVLMLQASGAVPSIEEAKDLTVGQRDVALLELRSKLFGDRCLCIDVCSQCATVLEFELSIQSLLDEIGTEAERSVTIKENDFHVEVRFPTTRDIEKVLLGTVNVQDQGRALLYECMLVSKLNDTPVAVEQLPEDISAEILYALGEAQSGADINFPLTCCECGFQWKAPFDAAQYLWEEIDRQARRLLHEVHIIASAYGWTDRQILSLPSQRRSFYLECIIS